MKPKTASPASKTVVFAWFTNRIGGLERLLATRARWFVNHRYHVVIITVDGPMTAEYKRSGASVFLFSKFENDFSAMGEWLLKQKFKEASTNIPAESGEIYYVGYDKKSFWALTQIASLRRAIVSRLALEYVALKIFYDFKPDELEGLALEQRIICINEASRLYLQRKHGLKIGPEMVVPIPVVFTPSADGVPLQFDLTPTLVTVARLEEMKEYIFGMIQQSAIFFEQFPQARLMVIGDGVYKKRLMSLPEAKDSRIIFIGSVPPADIAALIRQGTVFVGMGTAAVQAAALGVPVVVATAYDEKWSSPGYFSEQGFGNFGEEDETRAKEAGWDVALRLLRNPQHLFREAQIGKIRATEVFSYQKNMEFFEQKLRLIEPGIPFIHPPSPVIGSFWKRFIKRAIIAFRIK